MQCAIKWLCCPSAVSNSPLESLTAEALFLLNFNVVDHDKNRSHTTPHNNKQYRVESTNDAAAGELLLLHVCDELSHTKLEASSIHRGRPLSGGPVSIFALLMLFNRYEGR